MDLKYVSENRWREFFRRWPLAAAFLRHESLKGELVALRKGRGHASEADLRRLADLEMWEQAVGA